MNYREFRFLFQEFALQSWNNIQSFTMSEDARAMAENSAGNYPILQLDTPEFIPDIRNGSTGRRIYDSAVAILMPVAKDDHAGQDRALEILEPDVIQLLSYMDYKRKEMKFQLSNLNVFPLKNYESLGLWGWGIEFNVETAQSYCFTEDQNLISGNYLTPIWTEGETEISLTFGPVSYSANWTDKSQVLTALQSIVDDINFSSAGTGLSASVFLDSIAVLNTVNHPYSSPSGHKVLDKSGEELTA